MTNLGQADPKIYEAMTWDGALRELRNKDWFYIFSKLGPMGFIWDTDQQVLKKSGFKGMVNDTPWVHAQSAPKKFCGLDHHITFNAFGIIHPRCMECWKVVVTPTTFAQLMQLKAIQDANMQWPSKCGIELRDYTPKHYGGYYYCHSIDEGRERYHQVRALVNKHIKGGKKVSVILKRACTEYEMIKGPSPYWHNTFQEEEMIELIDAFVYLERNQGRQPDIVKTSVMLKWALWAHANGDMSYLPWNNNKPLFPGYVNYHEGDLSLIKHDLAVAKAQAIANIKPKDTQDFQVLASEFASERGLRDPGTLIHSLGATHTNPLGEFGMAASPAELEAVPEELKGEEDATS